MNALYRPAGSYSPPRKLHDFRGIIFEDCYISRKLMKTDAQSIQAPGPRGVIPQTVLIVLLMLGLSGFYLWVHPDYFGDAVWYARDIQSASRLPVDSGHLFWRPLGAGLVLLTGLDPLLSLQLLCALSAAVLVVFTYFLALAVGLCRSNAFTAAALVASGNFLLSYGASGSSYSPALALSVIAFLIAIRSQQSSNYRSLLFACICFALSWGLWGLTPLLLPAFCSIPLLYNTASLTSRAILSILIGLLVSILIVGILILSFTLFFNGSLTFFEWLRSSGHGIALTLSPMSLARAILGIYSCFFVSVGFGTEIKALILGELSHTGANFALNLSCFIVFNLICLITACKIVQELKQQHSPAKSLVILVISASAPVFLFAVLWQGSDIERFCLAMPFIAIAFSAFVHSSSLTKISRVWLLLFCFLNMAQLRFPERFGRENLIQDFISATRTHAKAGDFLVVTGQRIGHSVWAPIEYFSGVKVFSVLYDVQTRGSNHWNERLNTFVQQGLEAGDVYVLADLVNHDSPKGIGMLEKEYPRPDLKDLRQYFSKFDNSYAWQVDDLIFLKIRANEN